MFSVQENIIKNSWLDLSKFIPCFIIACERLFGVILPTLKHSPRGRIEHARCLSMTCSSLSIPSPFTIVFPLMVFFLSLPQLPIFSVNIPPSVKVYSVLYFGPPREHWTLKNPVIVNYDWLSLLITYVLFCWLTVQCSWNIKSEILLICCEPQI